MEEINPTDLAAATAALRLLRGSYIGRHAPEIARAALSVEHADEAKAAVLALVGHTTVGHNNAGKWASIARAAAPGPRPHRSHTWRPGEPEKLRRANSITYRRPCTHPGCKAAYVLRENKRGISLDIEEGGRRGEPQDRRLEGVTWERGLELLMGSLGGMEL